MIYLQSFFDLPRPEKARGKAFSIANSTPVVTGKVEGTVECLVPPWSLVRALKAYEMDWAEYTNRYRDHLRANWPQVKAWLQSLDANEDIYLCCWEHSPDECHRSLVAKMIRLHRPDIEVELK